jgi:hypothetical protein
MCQDGIKALKRMLCRPIREAYQLDLDLTRQSEDCHHGKTQVTPTHMPTPEHLR